MMHSSDSVMKEPLLKALSCLTELF